MKPRAMTTLVLILLLLGSTPIGAQNPPPSRSPDPTTLKEAVGQLLVALDSSEQTFRQVRGTLLIRSDSGNNPTAPLTAVLEREGRLAARQSGRFGEILLPGDLPFSLNRLDVEALEHLDRLGVDLVLDLSAATRGRALLLRARGFWLQGGSWGAALATRPAYPERQARVQLAPSPHWAALIRPAEELSGNAASWTHGEAAQTEGRVLDLALIDFDGDGDRDLILLLPDRLELWSRSDDALDGTKAELEFRYTQALDAPTGPSSRWPAGELTVCGGGRNTPARVAYQISGQANGHQALWNGRSLVPSDRLAHAPLACFGQTWVQGTYRPGTHLFKPQLIVTQAENASPKPITVRGPFISVVGAAPERLIEIGVDGRLTSTAFGGLEAIRCGQKPGWLNEPEAPLLICSQARPTPTRDRLTFWRLLHDTVREESHSPELPGALQAVTAAEGPEGQVVAAARYLKGRNITLIDWYQR